MPFHPYLNFPGTCRDAFTFYQQVFGGELYVMSADEMPAEDSAGMPDFTGVVHASLNTSDGSLLMASDAMPGDEGPAQYMYVSWTATDVGEAERIWAALSDGGTVEMALGETFFSPCYGVCVDRFGTPWMVNVATAM